MAGATKHARSGRAGVSRAARQVGGNRIVDAGVRAGYVVTGILHILIGWLALQIAFGNRGTEADQSGALSVVASSPVGWLLLIAVVVAFALLAVWQFTEIARESRTAKRVAAGAKAVLYLALAWGAVSFLRGNGNSSATQARDTTATFMNLPWGPILVLVAGIAVAGVGVFHIYKGWTKGFTDELTASPRFIVNAGRVGFIAKGVALIAVGGSLLAAGLTHRSSQSRGLDGALHDMIKLPLGLGIVTLVALGFMAYGIFSFGRARYVRT